jgi:hypothetical protein
MKHCIYSGNRRQFLKTSAAGAAGLVAAGLTPKRARASAKGVKGVTAWPDEGMEINPNILNTRVVFCHDPAMLTNDVAGDNWSMQGQNEIVDKAVVYASMDKMAVALAETATANQAWAAIFQEPAKGWGQTQVALKVNCIEEQDVPRLAMICKICDELNILGVPYGNMTIFDGCHRAQGKYDDTYSSGYLPGGVIVDDSLLGGAGGGDVSTQNITLPDHTDPDPCVEGLAAGNIDILVNFALNKGHSINAVGKFTLCMKNHYGTIRCVGPGNDGHPNDGVANADMIIAMNKSTEVLGDALPPRQQLCIVDSLWGMTFGPTGGSPDMPLHCLVMGTFAPIVDYLTVKKIRESDNPDYGMEMTDTNTEVLNKYMNAFGYDPSTTEMQNLDFVDASSDPVPIRGKRSDSQDFLSNKIRLKISGNSRPSSMTFSLSRQTAKPEISIFNAKGNLIRSLIPIQGSSSVQSITWDRRDNRGLMVNPGLYAVRINAGEFSKTRKLVLR